MEDTSSYRTTNFVNRYCVAAAAVIVTFLIAGVAMTSWQARLAAMQRDNAKLEAARARRIAKFMQETLGSPNHLGREVKVVDVLDKAATRAQTELADQPEVLAEVQRTIGYSYYNLEIFDKSEALLRPALNTFRSVLGENYETTAMCMKELGEVLAHEEKYDEAIPLLHTSAQVLSNLPNRNEHNVVNAKYSLAKAYYFKGDMKVAESMYREMLDYAEKHLGENDPVVAEAYLELANLIRDRDYDGAIALYRQAIKVIRPLPDKKNLATGLSNLGEVLLNAGQIDEAETVLHESLAMRNEIFGEHNPPAAIVRATLSRVSYSRGNYGKAEAEAKQAVQDLELSLPKGHRNFGPAYTALGRALVKNGKLTDAEKYLREGLDIQVKRIGIEDRGSAVAESSLGECLFLQKKYGDAEPLLNHGYQTLKSKLKSGDPALTEALQRLITFYELTRQTELATQYRKELAAN